jgi:6-phospho-3-hexuloisomerase
MSELFAQSCSLILEELRESVSRISGEQVNQLIDAIRTAGKVLVVGAGRMGIVLSAFCMRLNHLGFPSFIVGSSSCPPIGEQDLLLVASSSGETPTIREIVHKARELRARIAVITAAPRSTIATMATLVVHIQAPSSIAAAAHDPLLSRQPMKTLFEQTLFLSLEAMVLTLMQQTGQTASVLARRHANLE